VDSLKRLAIAFALAATALLSLGGRALSQTTMASPRPRITGISHLCVYTGDPAAAEHFYQVDLSAVKGADPEDPKGVRYYFSSTQYVEVLPLPATHTINRLDHIAFNTDNARALHTYLSDQNASGVTALRQGADGSVFFESVDPEGNKVQFVQPGSVTISPNTVPVISTRIIHVGLLVHDRAVEDKFYKGLLGFRPYWYGGAHPDTVDWVMAQVPDGSDWVEYMMVGDGSSVPLASLTQDEKGQEQLGVLDHFSLGVPNIEAAMTTLIGGDRLSKRHSGPLLGLDGKWQATLFDPDGTRVELMEFQPVIKPCCSPFTALNPTE